jgi:chemotaxis protein methyltransferase CheR
VALDPDLASSREAACVAVPEPGGAPAGGIVFLGDRAERARTPPCAHIGVAAKRVAVPEGEHGALFRSLCAARGLDATAYRAAAVRRRERACARAVGAFDGPLLADQVERGLSAVLIGVTSFFRDAAAFAALAAELDARADLRGRRLRVLSVGCSDGCELYSAGILLGERGLLDGAMLLGVDCRTQAVARASAGVYQEHVLHAVDAGRRQRWFEPAGDGAVRIRDELVDRATWLVADAFAVRSGSAADLLLCRNLAIYLRADAADVLWHRLVAALRPGGLLLVGKAERPPAAARLERIGPCLYRKEGA